MIKMIDVGDKQNVKRVAIAVGEIRLKKTTLTAIKSRRIIKGDVLVTAEVAALQAIKKTWEILPHCHHIPITAAAVQSKRRRGSIKVTVTVEAIYKTGVEMEALHGVSVALLTIWDMVKSLEKDKKGQYPTTEIGDIRIETKVRDVA